MKIDKQSSYLLLNYLQMNIITFYEMFKTDKDCLDYLREHRYKGFKCPKCGNGKFWMIYSRKCMECAGCGHQEYLTAGTIFHKSRTKLIKWFYAINLITTAKKGVSALWLKDQIKVTYKTAWRILHKIREAMDNDDDDSDMFGGITEVDETYIGGKEKFKHADKRTKNTQGRNTKTKTAVFGMLNRGGDVETEVVKNVSKSTLHALIHGKIKKGSKVMSDEWRSYNGLDKHYDHGKVNHSRGNYVNGEDHTNGIENFWSLLKRGIIGIYHHVSKKWLHNYLAEFEFRYNYRKSKASLFDILLTKV